MRRKSFGQPAVIESMERRTLLSGGLLGGAVIGTTGSYRNYGNSIAKVFDGNVNSYFDAPVASGAYVGLDLGSPKVVNQILFAPRKGMSGRMIGGRFQGSATVDFSNPVTLYTINFAPPAGKLTSVGFTNSAAFRYVRYLGPVGSYCDIAEAEFFTAPPPFATIHNGDLVLSGGGGNQNISANFTLADNTHPDIAATFTLTDNGRTETFSAGDGYRLLIELGNGNDQVTINGAGPVDLASNGPLVYVQLGNGNDLINANLANIGASITAGDGNDSIIITGSNDSIAATAGNGDDSLLSEDGASYHRTTLAAGNGNDTLKADGDGKIGQSVTMSAGTGRDIYTNNDPIATVGTSLGSTVPYYTTIIEGGLATTVPALYGGGVVFLDTNGNGLQDANEGSGTSLGVNGQYFVGPGPENASSPNSYRLAFIPLPGFRVVQPVRGYYVVPAGSMSTGYNFVIAPTTTKLTGKIIGTTGSFRNNGHTASSAFDGNLSTYFEGRNATGDWIGLDLGSPKVVGQVKLAPRPGYAGRVIGGQIQASDTPDFSSGVVQLYSVGTPSAAGLTTMRIANHTAYRYYRYFGPFEAYCDIAELEFDG